MCNTATEMAIYFEESNKVLKEHFDKLEAHIKDQFERCLFTAITDGPDVFYMQGCCDEDGMWVSQADAEYQEHLDDVEDYKDSFWVPSHPARQQR